VFEVEVEVEGVFGRLFEVEASGCVVAEGCKSSFFGLGIMVDGSSSSSLSLSSATNCKLFLGEALVFSAERLVLFFLGLEVNMTPSISSSSLNTFSSSSSSTSSSSCIFSSPPSSTGASKLAGESFSSGAATPCFDLPGVLRG